jgi:uncharacterized protein YprB with RNaseH-like and TPR domain
MRDLMSRLRAIVRQPVGRGSSDVDHRVGGSRELTYVPDLAVPAVDLDQTAALLGGGRHDVSGSACIVIDRTWEAHDWHGRRPMEAYAIEAAAPIALFDPRLAAVADWSSRIVFFDIETTGLSGGAGTLPLLAGCGWFERGRFTVRQFFLSGPSGERALLDGLAEIFDAASLLVTYNGRTFDVPVMETRWAFHRQANPSEDLPHFDMLPAARRLWGRGSSQKTASCTLTSLERSILRFHRLDDVPGLEIPSRYFQFLRTGDVTTIAGVLDHNRHDIVSLAAVTAHALRLGAEGPDGCENPTEQLGLGRLYERAGNMPRAEQAYALAAAAEDSEIAAHALARLAVLLRRNGRYDEAARAWQGVLELDGSADALERQAIEALAIHHEHRARDFAGARQYAETLRRQTNGLQAREVDRRLNRLERKIKKADEAARLLG